MSIVEYCGFQADLDNLPLPRAGVYQLINQVNGKCYIGISENVARRIRTHRDAKLKKLGNAIRKYGTQKFLAHPVAYSVDERTDWLPVLEAQLIAEFDAIKNGYNVIAASNSVGPYGEEFAQIIREYHEAHPEIAGPRFKKWWQSMTPEEREAFLTGREAARLVGFYKFYSDPEKVADKLNVPRWLCPAAKTN
jgi:group I intron endonuclease